MTPKGYDEIDYIHCGKYEYDENATPPPSAGASAVGWPIYDNKVATDGVPDPDAEAFQNIIYRNGVLQLKVERYSFWRFRYRRAGTDDNFIQSNRFYGTRSRTFQPVFNYIRIAFPDEDEWEWELEPVSGYEARNNTSSKLQVLDYRGTEQDVNDGQLRIWYTGEQVDVNDQRALGFSGFDSADLGIPQVGGGSNVDPFAKLSETFIYDEISTSCESGPEHEDHLRQPVQAAGTQRPAVRRSGGAWLQHAGRKGNAAAQPAQRLRRAWSGQHSPVARDRH